MARAGRRAPRESPTPCQPGRLYRRPSVREGRTSMAASKTACPVRRRLPRNYSTEIGRVIARWALFESRLRALAYLLLDVSPERGRLAVRGGRVADYLTMLEDLMVLRGVGVTVNIKALKLPLSEVEAF